MVRVKNASSLKPVVLSKQTLAAMGIVLLLGSIIFFAPYMGVISVSILLAYMFLPLYKRLNRKMPSVLAAWSVLLVAILAVLLPTAYITYVVIEQGLHAITALSNLAQTEGSQFQKALQAVTGYVESISITNAEGATEVQESVVGLVAVVIPSMIGFVINSVLGIVANLPVIFISATIFAFLFSVILRKHEEIGQFLYDISPLDRSMTGTYLQRSSDIVIASLRGQLILSFMSAVLAALLMIFLGLGQYFWFLVVLFTLLNMVPAGSGIVVIPVCLIVMASNFWLGFWVLIVYFVIVGNAETIIRPKLIPKKIDLIPALTILSIFCGIYYFGIMGVVYGPLIVILLTTTSSILVDQKRLRLEQEPLR